ncbi:MAG TPA: carbon-nitrogen hydrolase family protein [Burkholderiaceae bacterium]|nr:carbon-nitrogen hydrolase family protein [Burkholderiaceae bacterium]
MSSRVPVAAVQMLSFEGQPEENLKRMLARIDEAAAHGARLIVFPEASNNGYFFADRRDAHRKATPVPGPFTDALAKRALERGVWVATGLFEQGPGDEVYNCALLLGPDGSIAGQYHKNFFIKADKRWFVPGKTGFKVFDTEIGKLGAFVCADGRIPESARCLALGGAEVLLNPTNWGAPDQYLYHVPTRAVENRCWVIGATKPRRPLDQPQEMLAYNRFTGCSFIMAPDGTVLAQAGPDEETIIYAEIEPALARDKRLGDGNDLFADRRHDLYGTLLKPYDQVPLANVQQEPIVPDRMVRQVAAVQVSPPGEPEAVLDAAVEQCIEANFKHYADLAVFPEHFLFDPAAIARDPAQAAAFSRTALDRLVRLAADIGMWMLPHLVEQENDRFHSTVFCIGPQGVVGRYRATHLWGDEKRWCTPGDDLPVFHTPFGNVGVMIGYEGLFPEVARVMALQGADLIAWPVSWRNDTDHKYVVHERAMENRVLIVAANRQDSAVPGPSLIVQPAGYPKNTLASELPAQIRGFATRFVALASSRVKRETNNTDLLQHRRPQLYDALVEPYGGA